MTRAGNDAGWEYLAALVPFYFVGRDAEPGYEAKWGRPILMDPANEDEQKLFYNAVLELPWLAPKVRQEVMAVLGQSLQAQKRKIAYAWAATVELQIAEAKAGRRAKGQRDYSTAAVAAVAAQHGLTVAALKKRLVRSRRRSPRK